MKEQLENTISTSMNERAKKSGPGTLREQDMMNFEVACVTMYTSRGDDHKSFPLPSLVTMRSQPKADSSDGLAYIVMAMDLLDMPIESSRIRPEILMFDGSFWTFLEMNVCFKEETMKVCVHIISDDVFINPKKIWWCSWGVTFIQYHVELPRSLIESESMPSIRY